MKQMNTGKNISQRDLILIPFPFSDSSVIEGEEVLETKPRPVVVLSSNKHLNKQNDMICAQVTSNDSRKTLDESVGITDEDIVKGHLKEDSWVLSDNLMNLHQNDIHKIIGRLGVEKSEKIARIVEETIEIDSN